jgi:hypothetical protein
LRFGGVCMKHIAPTTNTAAPIGDKALHFKKVYELIGSNCRTGHTARALAKAGKIRPIYINQRTIRYSEKSVLELLAGGAR